MSLDIRTFRIDIDLDGTYHVQWPLGSPQRTVAAVRARQGPGTARALPHGHGRAAARSNGAPDRTAWGQSSCSVLWGRVEGASRSRPTQVLLEKPRTPSVTEPAPWVASYRKRRAKKVREPRVPNHAGYDDEVAALSRRSIVERHRGLDGRRLRRAASTRGMLTNFCFVYPSRCSPGPRPPAAPAPVRAPPALGGGSASSFRNPVRASHSRAPFVRKVREARGTGGGGGASRTAAASAAAVLVVLLSGNGSSGSGSGPASYLAALRSSQSFHARASSVRSSASGS